MTTEMLELRGYSTDRGHFLLATSWFEGCYHNSNNNNSCYESSKSSVCILERDFIDLQSWDHLLRRASSVSSSSCPRFPIKRLRKLSASSWLYGEQSAGWRLDLQKNVSVCEEWLNAAFLQLSTPQQREFLDEELYTATKLKRIAAYNDIKHAKDLQQYFTCADLVDLVVRQVLEHVKQRDAVWLEPSCGDGRFLTALLRAGAQHVIGYEIDERLRSIADRNVRISAANVARTISSEGTGVQAQVYLGDFLTSRSCVPADKFVVVIGNPPFGARGNDGSDLIHQFFQHAAQEWQADIIAFIVPERCCRKKFMATTLQQLSNSQSDDAIVLSWKLTMQLPLTDYQFEFGEKRKRVRQPSVLQLFAHNCII